MNTEGEIHALRGALAAAQRKLEAVREQLRLAHEAGRAGTFDWSIPDNRVTWSPELEALYGVPRGSFEGTLEHWARRVHPEDAARILAEVESALAQKKTSYNYEFRAVRPDGEERWLRGQSMFTYAEDGSPLRMIGINVDIHDRRLSEDALMRTEKLAAVGRLAASIAHEINNPLESVTNLLYLARHNYGQADIGGYLELAEQELKRVTAITHQTLRFYRQSTAPTRVTAGELLEEALSIYQARLANLRITVERHRMCDTQLCCFEGEIRQVLNNLISNAIDAMHGRGGRLVLRSRAGTDHRSGRKGVWITVADTGMGISRETGRRLFEPFFTTKGGSGTGLGLWVSLEIVHNHHGVLRYRSSGRLRGPGTVFSLFLPFEAAVR